MKIILKKGFFFLFFVLPASVFAQAPSLKVENGVSRALADYRHTVISNVHYKLQLGLPVNRSENINASETLSFDLNENKWPLQIDFKEQADHLLQVSANNKSVKIVFRNEHIVIDPEFLVVGKNIVDIVFIAGELSLNRNNDYLYTLLVPDRARTVFPCFDQPNIKARFQLTLTVPNGWQVLANASLLSSSDSGMQKKLVFNESDLFSTYLFSFVAGKFNVVQKKFGDRLMHFYYRETDTAKISQSVDSIFSIHRMAVDFLESYTQIKFPFQKLDFAAIPDFQYGGMEHVGAIDYKAASLFLDSGATKDQHNARSNLIAHETSHMWFGDLVTMQWFNDVWLKEVFANFMADKITQGSQDKSNYELKFLLTHFLRAYAVDRTQGANPIRQDLSNLNQAGNLYGAIIYDKAPVMMRQLERLMGAASFRDGLRAYLKKYSYSNATWPDLISILDRRTPSDLQTWNKVWVNTSGRPVLNYVLQQDKNVISSLTITQKGERTANYVLPQFFEIALVYPDHVEELTVNMNGSKVEVKEAEGKKLPLYILFNSSGQGYGVFPFSKKEMWQIKKLKSPLMRASAYINLYENMLDGNISHRELYKFLISQLQEEGEELTVNLIANYVTDIYWRLILPAERNEAASYLENSLWQALKKENAISKKKIFFRTFQSIAVTPASLDTLYNVWKKQEPPAGVKLSEDEYTSLALNLAVKEYSDTTILSTQLSRLTNIDRRQRLEFLTPAVSKDVNVRDAFFASLKNLGVRKKEAWVADALAYLHHPLRVSVSVKYLKESLDMLEEIQSTNDIFFPGTWLNASLSAYQTKKAANIVRNFLTSHPGYNPQLKMKILQAADPLFRAEKLTRY
ncbi:MAG: M1 family metallopeptidase [Flavisolibacter sp.]